MASHSHVLLSSAAGNIRTCRREAQATHRFSLLNHLPIRASTTKEPRNLRCGRSFLGIQEVLPTFCSSMAASARATSIFAATTTLAVYIAAAASFSWPSASAASPEAAFVKNAISSHQIVIFSKSYCPYCGTAKAVFKDLNKEPYVIELDEREDGYDIQEALGELVGRRTVPQVFVDGKHIGGSDDTVEAYDNGELTKLLGVDGKEDM
ncbi:unnamed protein product [Linum tenue]|uniref:Glutaredoxin domain-containing protein n=1 Tax=Linum tenue TaxID=586396 RepID=A0AAV0S460_9ROSI|nr:unnamed protein product [Linum tenue]